MRRPALGRDRLLQAVLLITGLGLGAKLLWLGRRITHFDEGRVGYWALRYFETGQIEYRFIVHGPFVQYLDAVAFALLGPSDFSLRLPVAIIGGLLPLAVLLFRDHLEDMELVVAAAFLAFNPVLLYYSRFLRSTIIVAAVMFVAFGCLVRFYRARQVRYVYLAVGLTAIGFAAKESAAVYILTWLGATALLIDHELFRLRTDDTGLDRLAAAWQWARSRVIDDRRRLLRYAGHGLGLVVVFVVIAGFFYAPRSGTAGGVGLWRALGNPALFPELIEVTRGDVVDGYQYWFGGTTRKETLASTYIEFLGRFLETVLADAGPLVAFAVIGFLVERYATVEPRNLVMFTSYWGFVSILGYPLGTDIYGAWIVVNALVPLTIPAGVGVALVIRRGLESLADDDRISVGIAALLLVLVVGQVGATIVSGVYLNPTDDDNPLVQYAQPADNFKPTLERIERIAAANNGVDILYFGSALTVENPSGGGIPPPCADLSNTLPLQWYFERYDAVAECEVSTANLGEDPPPVVITRPIERDDLAPHLDGYTRRNYLLRTFDFDIDIYYDPDALPSAGS